MKQTAVKNIWNFIFPSKKKSVSKNLSPQKAIELQKEYIKSRCDENTPSIEPYIEVAKQLFAPKAEVFAAAVYYLEQIALNKKDTAEAILAILQNYAAQNSRSAEDNAILASAVAQIRRKYNL